MFYWCSATLPTMIKLSCLYHLCMKHRGSGSQTAVYRRSLDAYAKESGDHLHFPWLQNWAAGTCGSQARQASGEQPSRRSFQPCAAFHHPPRLEVGKEQWLPAPKSQRDYRKLRLVYKMMKRFITSLTSSKRNRNQSFNTPITEIPEHQEWCLECRYTLWHC